MPTASGEVGGKVDWVIVKMHEPKVVTPVAVLPPELMENAGVVAVLVNASVVVATVPKSVTPAGNSNEVFATAAVVVGDAASVAFAAATCGGSSPPPPHAARVVATRAANMSLSVLFISGNTFQMEEGRTAKPARLQQTIRSVNKS